MEPLDWSEAARTDENAGHYFPLSFLRPARVVLRARQMARLSQTSCMNGRLDPAPDDEVRFFTSLKEIVRVEGRRGFIFLCERSSD